MVGRTPEYLGKKIGPHETRLIVLCTLAAPLAILSLTALAVATAEGLASLTTNSGAHGLTEILTHTQHHRPTMAGTWRA